MPLIKALASLAACLTVGAAFGQAPAAARTGPADAEMPGDVLVNGRVDAARYRATAAAMGTAAGIAYRYGPSAADLGYPATTVTYAKRPDKSYDPISVRLGWSNRSRVSPGGWCGTWQIGRAPSKEPGDFSSSIVNVAYVPDAVPPPSFFPKKYPASPACSSSASRTTSSP